MSYCSAHQIYNSKCSTCQEPPMDPEQCIGQQEWYVTLELTAREIPFRIVQRDDQNFMMTCEYWPDRYNLYIKDDIITKIVVG